MWARASVFSGDLDLETAEAVCAGEGIAHEEVVGLVMPTGFSFNMDGTAIYMSMAVLFMAHATGTSLSLGQQIEFARDFADAEQLLAIIVVIFVIGVMIDSLFGILDRGIRRRWGLLGEVA